MFSSPGSENSAFPVPSSPFVEQVALAKAKNLPAIQVNSKKFNFIKYLSPQVTNFQL
jgi:hypothetical protein